MSLVRSRACTCLVALSIGLGCAGTDDDTCEVPSGEISAVAVVVDSGGGIRATIDFERGDRRGAGAPLRLCEADVLTIQGQAPTESEKASRVEYSLSLPADAERTVRFSLDRQSQGGRIDLEVELPEAFEILTPMDGDTLALGSSPVIEWEPAVPDGIMRVRMIEPLGAGPCVRPSGEPTGDAPTPVAYLEPAGVQADDTGSHALGDVALAGPSECELSLELARVVLGQYPDSLTGGGRVEARVERSVDVLAGS